MSSQVPNSGNKPSEMNSQSNGSGESKSDMTPANSDTKTSLQDTQSYTTKLFLDLLNFHRKGFFNDPVSSGEPELEGASPSTKDDQADHAFPVLAVQESSRRPIHPSSDYYIYTKLPMNYDYKLVEFFIEGDMRKGVISPGIEHFVVQIEHPSGDLIEFKSELDTKLIWRYACSFESAEQGIYTITVKFGGDHVNGSPFNCYVSRNYSNLTPHTVVSSNGQDEKPYWKVSGIDIDRVTGKMYVTDKVTNQVHIFSADGGHLKEFGGHVLRRPCGIAVDRPNNRVIVASKETHRICFFTLEGRYLSNFGKRGNKDGEFNFPWGVAVSPCGYLIVVADSMNHRLQTFDKWGYLMNTYSMYATDPLHYKEEFDYPRAVAFDESGRNIYAVDFNMCAIFKFDMNLRRKVTLVGPGKLRRPQGLVVDKTGNIIVCDSGNNTVRVITSYGNLLATIRGDGPYVHPQDVAILPDGQIAVLDSSGVIRLF